MVSNATSNAGQSTNSHPTVTRHNAHGMSEQSARHHPTVSRVGYIHQHRQLQTLYSYDGEISPPSHTIPPLVIGPAGAVNGTEILFQAL